MKIAVAYASKTGNTEKAARLIAVAMEERGHDVAVMSVDALDFKDLAEADLVVVGTWVSGHFVIGQKPGDVRRLDRIPKLTGKNVALFMTYALNPGPALRKMEQRYTAEGANVVAGFAWNRGKLPAGVDDYVDTVLSAAPAPSAS